MGTWRKSNLGIGKARVGNRKRGGSPLLEKTITRTGVKRGAKAVLQAKKPRPVVREMTVTVCEGAVTLRGSNRERQKRTSHGTRKKRSQKNVYV